MTDSTATPHTRGNATPERPWLGLRAYGPADAAYFYGRDAEIRELYERICSNPLTVLYGRSGLGKSSLLGAGLLPKLKVEGRRAVLIRLRFDSDAPELGAQVHSALAAAMDDATWPQGARLWALAHQAATRELIDMLRPVLVFDQFEELYTLAQSPERRQQAQALLAELSELIENRPPVGIDLSHYEDGASALRVVLTLREDYLHQLERHKRQLPALMRNRMELLELSGPNALQAVLEPGRKIVAAASLANAADVPRAGATPALVEVSVAEAIVRHVAGRSADTPLDEIDAVPPLLSLLCAELNAARIEAGAPQITQAQLQGEAEQVLERFYQRSFEGMPHGVRKAIEDLLIDNGGRIREASSRDTVLDEMRGHGVDEPEACLAALVDGRLLTIEERAGAPRVELTHDLLVPLVARARERREAEKRSEAERVEAERLAAVERERLAAVNAVLVRAAQRALGRARDQMHAANHNESLALLAESQSYSKNIPSEDVSLLAQQVGSPNHCLAEFREQSHSDTKFSPNGIWILSLRGNIAQIHTPETGKAYGPAMEHSDHILNADFSPDSNRIATISADRTLRIWRIPTGTSIGKPIRFEGEISFVRFSPNGSRIFISNKNGSAQFWDCSTLTAIGTAFEQRGITSIDFSDDGTRLVTRTRDKKDFRLFDTKTGDLLVFRNYLEQFPRLLPRCCVARRRHSADYDSSSRLASGQNPSEI